MKIVAWTRTLMLLLVCSALLPGAAYSQGESKIVDDGIPIAGLVAAVAQKTGRKFVIDPRAHEQRVTLVNVEPRNLGYADFLAILEVHGLVAVDKGELVAVVPSGNARQASSPVVGRQKRADGEFVTSVIEVKSVSAPQLVPILRPLIPQHGHLAAFPHSNKLIISDSFGNVQRIRSIIEALDQGPPYKPAEEGAEASAKPTQ